VLTILSHTAQRSVVTTRFWQVSTVWCSTVIRVWCDPYLTFSSCVVSVPVLRRPRSNAVSFLCPYFLFFHDCTLETVTWRLRTDCIDSNGNLEREIQETMKMMMMMMMMMMSEVLEGCDRGRIMVAALTEFELEGVENWCRRYTIAH